MGSPQAFDGWADYNPLLFKAEYENGDGRLDVIEFVDVVSALGERADDLIRGLIDTCAGLRGSCERGDWVGS